MYMEANKEMLNKNCETFVGIFVILLYSSPTL